MHEACGKCLVSLLCHLGRLKQMGLCPKCGILQVTHMQVRHIPETLNGDGVPVKTSDTLTFRIDCPVRFLEEDDYNAWCQQGEVDATRNVARDEYDDLSQEDYCVVAALQARILIPDQGPPQQQYTNNTGGAIPVALCNQCYGGEYAERVP